MLDATVLLYLYQLSSNFSQLMYCNRIISSKSTDMSILSLISGLKASNDSCGMQPRGLFFALDNTSNPWKDSALENTFRPLSEDPKFFAMYQDMSGGAQLGIMNTEELLVDIKLLDSSLQNLKKVLDSISSNVPPMKSTMNRWLKFTEDFRSKLASAFQVLNNNVTYSNIGWLEKYVKDIEEQRQFADGLARLLKTQLLFYGKHYFTKDLMIGVETFRLNLPKAFSLSPVVSNVTQVLNGVSFLMTIDYCMEQLCLNGINATITYPVRQSCIYSSYTLPGSQRDLAFVLQGKIKRATKLGHMITLSNTDEITFITKRTDSQTVTRIQATFEFFNLHQKITINVANGFLFFQTEGNIFNNLGSMLTANASINIEDWSSLTLRIKGQMNNTSQLIKQLEDKVETYSRKLVMDSLNRINISKTAFDRTKARRKRMELLFSGTKQGLKQATFKRNKAEQNLTNAKIQYASAKIPVSVILGNNSNLINDFENACLITKCNYSCVSSCVIDMHEEQFNTSTPTRDCQTKYEILNVGKTVKKTDTLTYCKPEPVTYCEGSCQKSSSGVTVSSITNSIALGPIGLIAKDDSGLVGGCSYDCRKKPGPCKMVPNDMVWKSIEIIPTYVQEYKCSEFNEVLTASKSSGGRLVPRCRPNSCVKNFDPSCSQSRKKCNQIKQQIEMTMKGKNSTALKDFETMQDFGSKLNSAILALEKARAEEEFAKRKSNITRMRFVQLQTAENLLNVSLQRVNDADKIGVRLSRYFAMNNDTKLLTIENITFAMETRTPPKPKFPVNVTATTYAGIQKTLSVNMDFTKLDVSLTLLAERIISELFSKDPVSLRSRRSISTTLPPANVTENTQDFSDCAFVTYVNSFFDEIVKSLLYVVNIRNATEERLTQDVKAFSSANKANGTYLRNDTKTNNVSDMSDNWNYINLTKSLQNLHIRQSEFLFWNNSVATWRGFIEVLTNLKNFHECFNVEDCIDVFSIRLKDLYRFQDDVSEGEEIRKFIPEIITGLMGLVRDTFTVDEARERIEHLLALINVAQDSFTLCGEKPRILRGSPTNLTVVEGDNLALMCDWHSDTAATTQWSKNGKEIPKGTKKTLEILKISKNDKGVYNCKVSNRKGSTVSNATTVKVETKPKITKQPVSVQIIPGGEQTFEFICNTTGDPRPTLQWFLLRENAGMPEELSGYTQPRLYKQFSTSKPGLYFCEATNRNGVAQSAKARLDIVNATVALPRVATILKVTTSCNTNASSCSDNSLPQRTAENIKQALIKFLNIHPTLFKDYHYKQQGAAVATVNFTLTVDKSVFSNLVVPTFDDKARVIDSERRKMLQKLIYLYKDITSKNFAVTVNGTTIVGIPESLEASLSQPSCKPGETLHKNWIVCGELLLRLYLFSLFC